MKNIILQHFDGQLRPLDELSIENIQNYAKLVGAEYQLIRGKPFNPSLTPACQKVIAIDQRFDEYDNVLMLDIDMFVPKNMTINVFDQVGIGLHEEVQKEKRLEVANRYPLQASVLSPYWGGAIYKLSKDDRIKLRSPLSNFNSKSWMNVYNRPYWFEDEGIMHTLAFKSGFRTKDVYLDRKWCQCSFLPNPEKAGFIHIRTKITPEGPKQEKIKNYQDLVDRGVL